MNSPFAGRTSPVATAASRRSVGLGGTRVARLRGEKTPKKRKTNCPTHTLCRLRNLKAETPRTSRRAALSCRVGQVLISPPWRGGADRFTLVQFRVAVKLLLPPVSSQTQRCTGLHFPSLLWTPRVRCRTRNR